MRDVLEHKWLPQPASTIIEFAREIPGGHTCLWLSRDPCNLQRDIRLILQALPPHEQQRVNLSSRHIELRNTSFIICAYYANEVRGIEFDYLGLAWPFEPGDERVQEVIMRLRGNVQLVTAGELPTSRPILVYERGRSTHDVWQGSGVVSQVP